MLNITRGIDRNVQDVYYMHINKKEIFSFMCSVTCEKKEKRKR